MALICRKLKFSVFVRKKHYFGFSFVCIKYLKIFSKNLCAIRSFFLSQRRLVSINLFLWVLSRRIEETEFHRWLGSMGFWIRFRTWHFFTYREDSNEVFILTNVCIIKFDSWLIRNGVFPRDTKRRKKLQSEFARLFCLTRNFRSTICLCQTYPAVKRICCKGVPLAHYRIGNEFINRVIYYYSAVLLFIGNWQVSSCLKNILVFLLISFPRNSPILHPSPSHKW